MKIKIFFIVMLFSSAINLLAMDGSVQTSLKKVRKRWLESDLEKGLFISKDDAARSFIIAHSDRVNQKLTTFLRDDGTESVTCDYKQFLAMLGFVNFKAEWIKRLLDGGLFEKFILSLFKINGDQIRAQAMDETAAEAFINEFIETTKRCMSCNCYKTYRLRHAPKGKNCEVIVQCSENCSVYHPMFAIAAGLKESLRVNNPDSTCLIKQE